jgi:hypothetical protein
MGRARAEGGRLNKVLLGLIMVAASAGPGFAQGITVPTPQELEAKGAKPLGSEELKVLLTNNTLYHIVPKTGFRVPLHYLPDGTRFVRIRGEEMKSNWRIERDMVCEYSVVLKKDVCRSLYRSEGVGAICDEGASTCDFGLAWAPGNPEKLGR